MPSRPGSRLALVLALLAPLACGGRLLRTQLEPSPEARGQYLPVPVDAVRELPAPTAGPGWHERVTDVVGGPYELLASITTLGAGAGGAEQARASLRRRVAELGGDAMLVREVVREPSGPYTRADGLALKLLPPMPDAGERCDALVHPDSAGARVIACREAVRQRPGDEARRRHLLVAHVALMDEWERRNDGPRARDAWMSAARAIGDAYGRARDASPDAPWVRELVQHRRGDTTRAYGLRARCTTSTGRPRGHSRPGGS